MHDDVKKELIIDNQDDPKKQGFIDIVSTPGYEFLPLINERRFIKSHMPFSLLPPSVMNNQAKVS